MSQRIRVKRSTVPGRVPTTSELLTGELAVNVYDGILYFLRDNGMQEVIAVGQGSGPSSPFVETLATFSFSSTGATPIIIVPAGKIITEVVVNVTTAFNGTSLSLTVGDNSDNSSVVPASQTLLDTQATYITYPGVSFGSDTQISLYLTAVGGSQGAGYVTVKVQQ